MMPIIFAFIRSRGRADAAVLFMNASFGAKSDHTTNSVFSIQGAFVGADPRCKLAPVMMKETS